LTPILKNQLGQKLIPEGKFFVPISPIIFRRQKMQKITIINKEDIELGYNSIAGSFVIHNGENFFTHHETINGQSFIAWKNQTKYFGIKIR
jgi:hypothetical protein